MIPLLSVFTLSLLVILAFFIAWRVYISYKRTRDRANLFLSQAFILLGIHLLLFLLAIINYNNNHNTQTLLWFLVLSRIFLSIGIIIFSQSPIFMSISFYKKYNKLIQIFFLILIIIFSYLQLTTSINPFVAVEGVIVENIQSFLAKILMIFIPISSAILWCVGLIKHTPLGATRFFKVRMYFLGFGVLLAVLGNIVYIFSTSGGQSAFGISIVLLGYLSIVTGVLMPDIRRIFLEYKT